MNFFRKYSQRLIFGTIFVLAAANAFAWYAIYSEHKIGHSGNILTIAFLDIGQGDSIYIEAPNGNQIIFDGGPGGKILTELGKLVPFYDHTIDMIVVTNPDKDHFAGFIDLLDRYEIEKFMEPGTKSGAALYLQVKKAVDEQKAEKIIAKRGMRIVLDETTDPKHPIYIEILFPDQDVSAAKTNDGSIIARLVYGETSVMLTGDAPKKSEDRVVELASSSVATSILKSDVLKAGHHGSKTSSGENFVGKVAPKYAAISLGQDNKYGHPNIETLDTFEKFDIKVLRTDELGTIVMKSDGKTLWLDH